MMRGFSDEQLILLIREGQPEVFGVLVERYQKQIFSLAYGLSGDYEEAQDMCQEAFLRIFRELDKFDSSRRFFSWMYRVAYNVCLNMLSRRPQNQLLMEDDSFLADQAIPGPEEDYQQKELGDIIRQTILDMPEQYRWPLIHRYLEGCSYQQICSRLGLPLSTVETRLFRGKKLLRERLIIYLEDKSSPNPKK